MKKLIFRPSNFFGSGHFLIHEILKNRPKNDWSQKGGGHLFLSLALLSTKDLAT